MLLTDHRAFNLYVVYIRPVAHLVSLEYALGDGEMAQGLRALVALPEDLGSIPGTQAVDGNHL